MNAARQRQGAAEQYVQQGFALALGQLENR